MARGYLGRTYDREVLGRLLDAGMSGVDPVRARLLAGASGRVVELGFGTGSNLPFYPEAVTELVAVEPSEGLVELARQRLEAAGRKHQIVVGSASRELPLDAHSFDAAVITFVLCSVKHIDAMLAETRRLLKPDAPLFIAEHVLSHRATLATTQRLVRPLWKLALGGCDPARETRALLDAAGFDTTAVQDEMLALPYPVSSGMVGIARVRA